MDMDLALALDTIRVADRSCERIFPFVYFSP